MSPNEWLEMQRGLAHLSRKIGDLRLGFELAAIGSEKLATHCEEEEIRILEAITQYGLLAIVELYPAANADRYISLEFFRDDLMSKEPN